LGGGVEWALGNNWTVKGEFLYLNFGSVSVPSNITNNNGIAYSQGLNTSSDLTARIARLGVNYKF
jgi:outer membrane immunogenic protein